MKNLLKVSMGLAESIERRNNGFSECNIEIEEMPNEKDTALVKVFLSKYNHHFICPVFGYFQNPSLM